MSAEELDLADLEAEAPTFVQVPNALVDSGASPMALAAYVHLRRFAAWSTGRVSFSLQVLAQRMGLKQARSIRGYVQELETLGYVTIREQHGANGQRLRNLYVVRLTPLRSTAPPPCGTPQGPPAVHRTASTDDLRTDDLRQKPPAAPLPPEPEQIEAADAALLPAAEDVVIQAWMSRLQAAGAGSPRALTAPQRAALRKQLRAGVMPERMVQVLGWAFTDPRGAFWRSKISAWGGVLKHWPTMQQQCPADWREQVPLDLWHQQQDAALAADRAVRAEAARQAYGLSQADWDALPEDDRTDLLAVAAAPSEPDWEPEQTTAPAVVLWAEDQRRALAVNGWD